MLMGYIIAFARTPTGRFIILDYLDPSNLEYFFLHGINDAEGSGVFVIARAKAIGDRPALLCRLIPIWAT